MSQRCVSYDGGVDDNIRASRSSSWPADTRCGLLASSSFESASTIYDRQEGPSSDTLATSQSLASSSNLAGHPWQNSQDDRNEVVGALASSRRSRRRRQTKCQTCKQHHCDAGKACEHGKQQRCIYCHSPTPGECDKRCPKCFRDRCQVKWWLSEGNPNQGVCQCTTREDRERYCHSISSQSCNSDTPNERNRINNAFQMNNSEEMEHLLNFNLMVNAFNQLPQQALEDNRASDVSAIFRKTYEQMTQRRTLGPGSEGGLFLADAIYVRVANAMCSDDYSREDHARAALVMGDFLENIWPRVAPFLCPHRTRVLIVCLESETMEECSAHFQRLHRALRSSKTDPRVVQKMFHDVSDVDLSWATVLWMLGHSETGSELKCVKRKILSGNAIDGIDFAFLGVCNSLSVGMVFADAGIPTMCLQGLEEPCQVYGFAKKVLKTLLQGVVDDNGSSTALVAQITAAFLQAGGSNRKVYNSAFRCRRFCQSSQAHPQMHLLLPSSSGRLLDKIRRWPKSCGFVTFFLVVALLVSLVLRACPYFQCISHGHDGHSDRWFGSYTPCNGIHSISFPQAGGKVRILAVDLSCHDQAPAEERQRIDVHSGQIASPSFLVVSHSADVDTQESVGIWVNDRVGPHFFITRNGYLITLVHADQKAFFVEGCFERSDFEANCSRLEADAHLLGIMLEGNGCVKTFSDDQYATLFWLVNHLRHQGYNLTDDRIMPITEPDFFHGRMVAPCHHFDWMRLKNVFKEIVIPRSWNGTKDIERKQNWSAAVDVDYFNKKRIYGDVEDFRRKWKGFYGECPMSECIASGIGC